MELLRNLASLSDEQLKRQVSLRSFDDGVDKFQIERFCIWSDDITPASDADVEIQLSRAFTVVR
jgi:hypothetical protein